MAFKRQQHKGTRLHQSREYERKLNPREHKGRYVLTVICSLVIKAESASTVVSTFADLEAFHFDITLYHFISILYFNQVL